MPEGGTPEQLDAPLDPLTQREMDILELLAKGLSNQSIADSLVVTLETVKWYNKQIYSKLNAANRTQAVAIAREMGLFEQESTSHGNLPAVITPFIGREDELDTLLQIIHDGDQRLVTILGPGGMGKTRLAVEAASHVSDVFADGVWLVDLAPLREAAQIPAAIANALHLTLNNRSDIWAELADYLADRSLLLVLDNFETVLDAADDISLLLNAAPALTILTTSRERLNLQAETVITIGGLVTGEGNQDAQALFLQRARQVLSDFTPDAHDNAAIDAICQLVDNMPLAIVLAASLSSVLTLPDIEAELSRNLDLLRTEMGDLPARHRSIRAVFNHSWELLSPEDQKVLSRLSVFRGGFGLKTARQIAHASIDTLANFVRKSLINHDPSGLYYFHDVLRQYAEEKLIHIASSSLSTRTGILLAWSSFVRGDFDRAEDLVASIFDPAAELEEDLSKAAFGLALSGCLAGVANDYQECTRRCVASLAIAETPDLIDPIMMIFAYFGLAIASCGLGQYRSAQESIQAAMEFAEQLRTPAFTLIFLPVASFIKAQNGKFEEATRLLSFATNHPAGTPAWLAQWSLLVHLEGNLRAQLGEDVYDALWEEGESLNMQDIIQELVEHEF